MIRVEIDGLGGLEDKIRKAVSDLSAPMEAAGLLVQGELERSFAGGRLQRTGRLRKSFTQKGAEGNLFRVSNTELVVGSDLPYAELQEKRSGILPEADRVRGLIDELFQAYLEATL